MKLKNIKSILAIALCAVGLTAFAKPAAKLTNGVKLIWNAAKDLPAGFKAQNVEVKVTVEK